MNAFFADLAARGIRVLLDDNGALRVKGKKEQLDAALVAQLKHHKSEIAAHLKAQNQPKVSLAEQKHLIEELNKTDLAYFKSDAFGELTLHGLLEAQVVDHPNKIAIEFKDGRLSYAQLNQQANRMATFLRREGIEADDLVGLCLDSGIGLIVAMLAVLKSGGAFVVVKPDNIQPSEDCQFSLMLSHSRYLELFKEAAFTTHCVDALEVKQAIEVCSPANPKVLETQNAFSLACVVFGQCPQGIERGVMIEHGNLISLIGSPNYIKLSSSDTLGFSADPASDIALFEIFGALANGATLIELNRHLQSSPAMLKQALALKNVNVLHVPMALVSHLVSRRPDCFAGLDHLLFSGRQPNVDDINKLVDGGKPRHLTYVYGNLENTVFSTSFEITGRIEQLPLGKPISAAYCHILDENQQLVPQGQEGLLYVGGFGLARGYIGNWHDTETRFLPSPFSDDPNDRIFCTHQKACYLPDGNIRLTEVVEVSQEQMTALPAGVKRDSSDGQSNGRFMQPVWQSQPMSTLKKTALLPGGCFMIFCDNYGIGNRLAQVLRLASQQVITVKAGQGFEQLNEQAYLIATDSSNDYGQLMAAIKTQGIEQLSLIHLFSTEALDTLAPCEPLFEQLARFERHLSKGLQSIALLRQCAEQNALLLTDVNIVTRQCCSVTSDERLIPSAATIGALQDKSNNVYQLDLGLEQMPPTPDKINQICDFIAAELTIDQRMALVAYRGKQRWKVTESRCSQHLDNGINIGRAGHFLLLGSNGDKLNALAKQLKEISIGAQVMVLGNALTQLDEDIKVVDIDIFDADSLLLEIDSLRQANGPFNGIIYCPASDCPAHQQIKTLLALDIEARDNPTEFCLVLTEQSDLSGAKVAASYIEAFVQNKHNQGCERWLHVQLTCKAGINGFSIPQLMQLERIPNLVWRS